MTQVVHHHQILKEFTKNISLKDSDKVEVSYEVLEHTRHEDITWISYINSLRWVFNVPNY